MSEKRLRILHLEDSPADAELIERVIKREGINCEKQVVATRTAYEQALGAFNPDVVLTDHSLPGFDSLEAINLLKKTGLQIPIILVTGAVSEDFAVQVMKEGAYDFILKDRLQRLPGAILGAVEKYRIETERLRYLQQVITNEALMKEAEQLARFGSWRVNLKTGDTLWSDETYRILGYQKGHEKPTLRALLNCLHPNDAPHIEQAIYEAIDKVKSIRVDFRVIDNNDAIRYIRGELVVQQNTSNAEWLTGFIQDITEIKEAENKIKALNETLEKRVEERTRQLAEANSELESFTVSVSHDLRTPLQIIGGYATRLLLTLAKSLSPDDQQLLTGIKQNVKAMGQLIDDLLNLSHHGSASLNKEQVNLTDLVQAVVAEQKLITNSTASITVHPLPPAYCDAKLIKQVWVNLVNNALKYSANAQSPAIVIGATQKPEGTTYYVADNGTGFDMKDAPSLFKVFNRLHKADDYPGTGVGLALVQRIVTRHGGQVWAEGEPGKGATFYFTLTG